MTAHVVTPPELSHLTDLPGLDPAWSRWVDVTDTRGATHRWHVLDTHTGVAQEQAQPAPPVGTLLCVHGNPTWSYLWRGLLAAPPAGWRVVAPDQLGMGFSDRPAAPRSLAQRVDDLGDLTDALGLTGSNQSVVTVGHDWGGSISLGWALAHRAQLRGVVLGNTAVALGERDSGPPLIRLAHHPLLRELVCTRTPAFVRATTALSRPALPKAVRDAFALPYATAGQRGAVGDFVADIPFSADDESAAPLAGIAEGLRSLDVPALLFWGPRDPVFGERYLADLRDRLPRANLHRYEGASHLVTEDAAQYAGAVAQWVTDLAAGQDSPSPAADAPNGAAAPTANDGTRAYEPLWSRLVARSQDWSPAYVETGGTSYSWAWLSQRVDDLAAGLVAAGLRPGHRVAMLVPPSVALTAAVYAVWRAGGVIVVADRGLGLSGMRRALRSASVDHVIGDDAALVAAGAMGLPGSRIATNRPRPGVGGLAGVDHLVDDLVDSGGALPAPPEPHLDDECAVVFTSGATGPAKGVVYRHRQVAAQIALLRQAYAITDDDRLVAAFAPFSLLGPALGIATCIPDIDVTAPETLTAPLLADAALQVGASLVFAAPAALRRVAETADEASPAQRAALGRVQTLVSAGAPVPSALLHAVRRALPAASAHTPYGMTEALPLTDIDLAGIDAAGPGNGVCVGRPLSGVDLALAPLSTSTGLPLTNLPPLTTAAGLTGEICVRAAHVKERYDALWATQRASAAYPGWHRTSDVGHLDTEGRLWVEGRLAHVVHTASGPVTPVGVEQRVEAVDGVAAAAVVGVGPPGAQVVVVVVVVVVPGATQGPPAGGPAARKPLADRPLTAAIRAVAGVDVAAVLVKKALPLDIRHQSKIDRKALGKWATRVLRGSA
ncbi:alpha/beta fold hydrolase [Lapillicoccus sp.]|uniref:alpha/beta fold hydrolase n=1 Tax=Lapillicoccus sp. TaxID=1909287 RepID=UPI00326799C3